MQQHTTAQNAATGETLQLVTFQVGGEEFGIDILRVQEIIRTVEPTVMPGSGPDIQGVVNLRGRVIPIVDLRKRFGFEPADNTDHTRIVFIEINGGVIGFTVDSVHEVLRLDSSIVEPASGIALTLNDDFVSGVGKLDDRLLIMLDVDRLFSTQEIAAMEDIAKAA